MDGRSTFRMRVLARTLRRLREEAGLSQRAAGEALRFSDSKISRMESAAQLPEYHGFRAMLDLYGITVDQWDPLLLAWERAGERGWWHTYGLSDKGYVSMEDEAERVREFQLGFVPGLLQTPDYVRGIFRASRFPPAQGIDTEVAVRVRRQQRLTAEPSLHLHAVIDESVMRRGLPATVMRGQLDQILIVAELDTITVQVLPCSTAPHNGLSGSFTVLSFPDPDDQDVGYVEHITGGVHIEDRNDVATCKLVFDDIAAEALSPAASLALIERLADEL